MNNIYTVFKYQDDVLFRINGNAVPPIGSTVYINKDTFVVNLVVTEIKSHPMGDKVNLEVYLKQ